MLSIYKFSEKKKKIPSRRFYIFQGIHFAKDFRAGR